MFPRKLLLGGKTIVKYKKYKDNKEVHKKLASHRRGNPSASAGDEMWFMCVTFKTQSNIMYHRK